MSHESWHKQKQDFESLCKIWDKAQADGIFAEKNSSVETRSDFFGNYTLPEDTGIKNDDAGHWMDVISRSAELAPDESMMLMEAAKKKAAAKKKKVAKAAKSEDDLNELGIEDIEKEVKRFKKSKSGKGGDVATGDVDITAPFARVKSSLEYGKIPSLKKKVKNLANQPQHVNPGSVGPDQQDQHDRVLVTAGLAAHPKYGEIEKLKHKIEQAGSEMSGLTGLDEKKAKAFDDKYIKLMAKLEKLSSDLVTSYKKSRYYN
jgi:hypothetical protein